MSEHDADRTQDSWLTLAEVTAELRVNPATVRLWIARGRLPATRPGQRKLLVRRSDVDRMLGQSDSPKPTEIFRHSIRGTPSRHGRAHL